MSDSVIPLGLSFDDVLLVPLWSRVLPGEADVRTRLTSRLPLNIPVLSAAMDTVTEADLAVALAREGGLGVIHRNMSIDKQAAQVASVKRSESTVITNPFTVHADMTVGEMQRMMAEKGVAGFPVVTAEGKLEGMVTNRDIWFIENPEQRVSQVMTERTPDHGNAGTTLDQAQRVLYQHRIENCR